jgi:hypothetical protein
MRRLAPAVLVVLFAFSFGVIPLQATLYEQLLCPPYVGTFNNTPTGLTVTIVKENDKVVVRHTEELANPLKGKDAEAAVKRGAVQFNAHIDKDNGRLFVHWESLQPSR